MASVWRSNELLHQLLWPTIRCLFYSVTKLWHTLVKNKHLFIFLAERGTELEIRLIASTQHA
jgi:hypothetical protein